MALPSLQKDDALAIISAYGITVTDNVVVLGIRAHNNRINIYDDTIAIVSPDFFEAYNGNTDPSVARPGVATLQPGVYRYKKGLHGIHHLDLTNSGDKTIYEELLSTGKDHDPIPGRILPYWALRQDGVVILLRGGQTTPEKDGWPEDPAWIDIHKGGYNTTSSLGCQTVYPDLWPSFRDHIFELMTKYNQSVVTYCLVQA